MADQNLNIIVRVQGAQTAEAQLVGVGKATQGVGTATEETSKKTGGLTQTMKGLAAGFAVYKGAQFIRGAIQTTTDLAKATMGLERITGMDAKTASAWVAIAKERGVQSRQLNMGFIALSRNIVAAEQGTKASKAAFDQLGISAKSLQGLSTEQVVGKIADAFQKLPNGAEKAALAQRLFGRSAQALLPLLNQGSGALNDQIKAMAAHTGITNSNIKSQMRLVQQQRELNASMLGVKVAVATALVPILTALAQIIAPIASGFARLMQASTAFRVAVVALTAALIVFIAAMKLAQLAELSFIATAAPWLALAVAIGVALVMLYNRCGWFRAAVQAAMRAVVAAFNWVKNAAMDVFNWVKGHWPLLASILGGPLVAAIVQVITHFNTLKGIAVSVFNAIKSAAQGLASVVSGVVVGAFNAVKSAIQGVVSAINDIITAANKIASLPGKVLKVLTGGASAVGGFASSLNPFHQTGGYASNAGAAVVGEAGPELVTLPQGAQVHPFVTGGLGGASQPIHTHVYLDGRQIATAMGNYVAGQQAAR